MGVDHLVLGAIIRRLSVAVAEAACLEVGAAVGGAHAVARRRLWCAVHQHAALLLLNLV